MHTVPLLNFRPLVNYFSTVTALGKDLAKEIGKCTKILKNNTQEKTIFSYIQIILVVRNFTFQDVEIIK